MIDFLISLLWPLIVILIISISALICLSDFKFIGLDIKQFRINIANKLEVWGKKHGLYAVPTISTVQIRRELLRTPLYTDKEKHIISVIRKFMVNQPTSIHIILEDIKDDFPTEYSIALPEYEAILDEKYRHTIN